MPVSLSSAFTDSQGHEKTQNGIAQGRGKAVFPREGRDIILFMCCRQPEIRSLHIAYHGQAFFMIISGTEQQPWTDMI